MITGWRYYWRRYLGWCPLQPCIGCRAMYWGGIPKWGKDWWQPSCQEFCTKACYDANNGGLWW